MMQNKNAEVLELIQNYYNFFNNKNFIGMLSLVHSDIVHDINQGQREVGKNTFSDFLKSMDFHYDEHLTDIALFISQDGSRAAAEFICHGIYKQTAEGLPPASGQKYAIPVGTFFEIKNNLISRITNHYNLSNWIEQVNA